MSEFKKPQGRLWPKTSKAGTAYWSGTMYLGEVKYRLTMFNNNRRDEKDAEFYMYVEPYQELKNDEPKQNYVSLPSKRRENESNQGGGSAGGGSWGDGEVPF